LPAYSLNICSTILEYLLNILSLLEN